MRVIDHHRVVEEARIVARILDHHHLVRLQDGVAAEGDVATGFGRLQQLARLEPLAVLVDQGDRAHARAAQRRGDRDQIVERPLAGGIQDLVALQRQQALRFIVRLGRLDHRGRQ